MPYTSHRLALDGFYTPYQLIAAAADLLSANNLEHAALALRRQSDSLDIPTAIAAVEKWVTLVPQDGQSVSDHLVDFRLLLFGPAGTTLPLSELPAKAAELDKSGGLGEVSPKVPGMTPELASAMMAKANRLGMIPAELQTDAMIVHACANDASALGLAARQPREAVLAAIEAAKHAGSTHQAALIDSIREMREEYLLHVMRTWHDRPLRFQETISALGWSKELAWAYAMGVCYHYSDIPVEYRTEELALAVLQKKHTDGHSNKFLKDFPQTEAVCWAALRTGKADIGQIKAPTEEMTLFELTQRPSHIREAKPLTRQMVLSVLENGKTDHYDIISLFERGDYTPTADVAEKAARRWPKLVRAIPQELQQPWMVENLITTEGFGGLGDIREDLVTEEMADAALEADALHIGRIPERLRTPERIRRAVMDKPEAIACVRQTEELCLLAIGMELKKSHRISSKLEDLARKIYFCSPAITEALLDGQPTLIKTMTKLTKSQVLAAVSSDGGVLSSVRGNLKKDPDVAIAALAWMRSPKCDRDRRRDIWREVPTELTRDAAFIRRAAIEAGCLHAARQIDRDDLATWQQVVAAWPDLVLAHPAPSEAICLTAVQRDPEQLGRLPEANRSTAVCAEAVRANPLLARFIPAALLGPDSTDEEVA